MIAVLGTGKFFARKHEGNSQRQQDHRAGKHILFDVQVVGRIKIVAPVGFEDLIPKGEVIMSGIIGDTLRRSIRPVAERDG